MTTRDPNRNALWGRAIAEELVRSGVRHVVISPGSRSTPLTLALCDQPGLVVHSQIDERAAAFFALGAARSSGQPAALLCTSGSAAAHYLPALIEADHSRLPLIAISADRPPELMACGAGQTIDQVHLFGHHVREFVDAGTPEVDALSLRHLRARVDRLVARASGRLGGAPGPVHLNLPMREPLAPTRTQHDPPDALYADAPDAAYGRADGQPFLRIHAGAPGVDSASIDALAAALHRARRPLLVVGPSEPADQACAQIAQLASQLDAPLIADPASGLRAGPWSARVMTTADAVLRDEVFCSGHTPDLVLRFGTMPTAKPYRLWRERSVVEEFLVDPHGELYEPTQQASHLIVTHPSALIPALQAALARLDEAEPRGLDAEWTQAFMAANAAATRAIEAACAGGVAWEVAIARAVFEAAPEGASLFVASSMPIRDMDTGSGARMAPLPVLASRGANGIDGLIATALGSATEGPIVAVLGDVATLHDIGALLSATRCGRADGERLDATFVLINNSGGGIFSFLPIAGFPTHFERHFLTTHTADFAALCAGYGVEHVAVGGSLAALRAALGGAYTGVRVIEVTVDREDNVRRHRALWPAVQGALREVGL
jgi:2-succinyl-5-enolpyruvyl-6-hydroxy-3-cyclohexene-1-carboxylate synthase